MQNIDFNKSLGLIVSSATSTLPVSLSEAKQQLRITDTETSEDTILTSYIKAAADYIERETNRAPLSQTYIESFGPICGSSLILGRYCASEITSVQYLDQNETWQTMTSSDYYLSGTAVLPSLLILKDGSSWPDFGSGLERLRITYKAGYASTSSIPQQLKQAILFLTAHYFENRMPVNTVSTTEVPLTVQASINLLKIHWL